MFGNFVQFFFGNGGNSDVEAKLEKPFGAFDQFFLKHLRILQPRLDKGVDQVAVLDVGCYGCLHFGDFALKIVKDAFGFHWVRVKGNFQGVLEVN